MDSKLVSFVFVLACLSLPLPSTGSAQHADEILNRALERYNDRMAEVENYTLVQDVMGFEMTSHFERRMVDGQPVYVPTSVSGATEQTRPASGLHGDYLTLARRARLDGKETVDGHEVYVLSIEDFGDLESQRDERFTPRKGTFYLDTDDYLMRRMVMEGVMEAEGEDRPITMNAAFRDYRQVSGMIHPFRTELQMTGMSSAVSEEELAEARKSLEELKREMEDMPESQRAMIESMMGPQIERLEEMVNSGTMEFTVQVKELRVNEGPPAEK